ncbi:DUF721 domain-containing protein [Jiulongibacter sediminis]|uniref:RNA-binding protein n=1 Tax=Jiulongibacter sediminis TaxID=1605367 RepID=A0A0P7BER6_9BACT|nr:DUF721 domain-containing protein [Jiulongibacter sediminis]KPM49280.1 RNA-binding protein [Jiulongibacter sediminis]
MSESIVKPTSRRTKAVSLKDAIDGFLESFNLQTKYSETHLIVSWEKLMGKTIASRTEKIYIRDNKLFLKISSSPLRQELVMAKSKLIKLINKEMGNYPVEDVIFF